jgi:hypothetical protein
LPSADLPSKGGAAASFSGSLPAALPNAHQAGDENVLVPLRQPVAMNALATTRPTPKCPKAAPQRRPSRLRRVIEWRRWMPMLRISLASEWLASEWCLCREGK